MTRPAPDHVALHYHAHAKSALVAYLLWFFLGYGGVHRMYLGRWVSGVVMLAVFALSWVLTLVVVGFLGLGLIFLWWLVDALLIPGLVGRSNEALIRRLTG